MLTDDTNFGNVGWKRCLLSMPFSISDIECDKCAMLKIFCSCIYLTCILATNIREIVYQNFTTEDYHSDELQGCRLQNNSEIVGLVAFCIQYQSNQTSYLFPRTVTQLQLYQVYNLPPNVPLAPNLEQLLILEIVSCKLQKITSYMFEGFQNLTRISLKFNYIGKLPSDAFKHNLLLETIDLSENYIFSISGIAPSLRSLKLLKNLDLSKNRAINRISDHDFEPLQYTSLQVLDLSDCELSRIDRNAFQWLRYLVSLNVARTRLGDVALQNLSYSLSKESLMFFSISELKNISYFPKEFFSWLTDSRIEYINLSKNRFSFSFFQDYSPFKILNVDYCDIMLLPFEVISEMPFLEVLKMKHHFVTQINQQFKKVKTLKTLDMSEFATVIDGITVTIVDFAFENLKELELLDLSLLPLRNGIQRNTFSGLSNLKKLGLQKCYIYHIEDYSFETLNNLELLDLSNNIIEELSNYTFYGLRSVELIRLRQNRLAFLNDSYAFKYTPKLKYLNIENNKILHFPSGMFLNMKHLSHIMARNNYIQPWTEPILPQNQTVVLFELHRNKISYFTKTMLKELSNVKYAILPENPLNCSHCSTKDLKDWLKSTNTTFLRFANDNRTFLCHEPPEIIGILVEEADLNFLNSYCIPKVLDVAKIVYCTLGPLLVFGTVLVLVWYRFKWNIKYLLFLARSRTRTFKERVICDRYAFDAFISYCNKDLPWVRNHLLPAIENDEDRIACCIPDRNFIAGNCALNTTAAAISQSRTTVLVVSNEYLKNDDGFETAVAEHKLFEETRNGLILILLEPIHKDRITKHLQYVIRTRTCIQWTQNATGQKLFWKRLRLAIMHPENKSSIFSHIT